MECLRTMLQRLSLSIERGFPEWVDDGRNTVESDNEIEGQMVLLGERDQGEEFGEE